MEPYRIAWLPQFVRHYRGLGVERFLLSLHVEPSAGQRERDREFARFRGSLALLGLDDAWLWEHEFNAPALIRHQRTLQSQCLQPGDWVVWCDADEFQVYPSPLADIIARCEARDIDFVRGVFVDRVAADYSLTAFDANTPVWNTFPRTCDVTLALAAGDPRKVVLARASVIVAGGKHAPISPAKLNTLRGWVQVHHFKWDAMLVERLRYRVRPEWRARFPWWVESQRILDYLTAHDFRFDPADLKPLNLQGAQLISFE